jgi:hypothetical protein
MTRTGLIIAAVLLSSAALAQEPHVTLTIGPVHRDNVRQDHWVDTRLVNHSGRYLLSVRHKCQWLSANGRVVKEIEIGHGDLLPGAAQTGRPGIHSVERITNLRCQLARPGKQNRSKPPTPKVIERTTGGQLQGPNVRSVDNPAW